MSSVEQRMQQRAPLIRERMKTPRAAAVAGILFSVLLTTALVLLRISVPVTSKVTQLESKISVVVLALNLAPFAGIAFLWFVGVVRDRLGAYEDCLLYEYFHGDKGADLGASHQTGWTGLVEN